MVVKFINFLDSKEVYSVNIISTKFNWLMEFKKDETISLEDSDLLPVAIKGLINKNLLIEDIKVTYGEVKSKYQKKEIIYFIKKD